jgi:Uncharacterized protein conserved in bacteria
MAEGDEKAKAAAADPAEGPAAKSGATTPPAADAAPAAPMRRGRCPTCGAPTDPGFRPFCSKRCADVDLHRWFSGAYRIPVRGEADDEDGAPGDDPAGQPED